MRCEFHPEALAEYEAAARYYAGCQEGLDLRFMMSVEAVVRQISAAPDRWRILEQDVRRCLTKVFPYAFSSSPHFTPDRRDGGDGRERLVRSVA